MRLSGFILAAGASRRMGVAKALLQFGGETFLDRLIGAFRAASCSPVVAVLGHEADRIRAGLRLAAEATFIVNPDYTRGQLSSLQCGLAAIPADAAGVIFTPVDYPAVRADTVAQMTARFERRAPYELFFIPRSQGKHGHPVCFARELIPEFLALPPDAQARDVVRRHRDQTVYIDADDPGILEDADDPEAYQRLLESARLP